MFRQLRTGRASPLGASPGFALCQADEIGYLTNRSAALDHRRVALPIGEAFVPAGFVPECKLESIPDSKFVKDNAKVVFHAIFGHADYICHLAILESLGDELDDLVLARAGDAGSVESRRGCTRWGGLHSELLIRWAFCSSIQQTRCRKDAELSSPRVRTCSNCETVRPVKVKSRSLVTVAGLNLYLE